MCVPPLLFAGINMNRDHVFNKATSSIQVEKDDDGEVKVVVKKEAAKKTMLYGSFVKSGG
jgi:hypothetical protein